MSVTLQMSVTWQVWTSELPWNNLFITQVPNEQTPLMSMAGRHGCCRSVASISNGVRCLLSSSLSPSLSLSLSQALFSSTSSLFRLHFVIMISNLCSQSLDKHCHLMPSSFLPYLWTALRVQWSSKPPSCGSKGNFLFFMPGQEEIQVSCVAILDEKYTYK